MKSMKVSKKHSKGITTLASNSVNKRTGKTTIKIVLEHLMTMNSHAVSRDSTPSPPNSTTSSPPVSMRHSVSAFEAMIGSPSTLQLLTASLENSNEQKFLEAVVALVESEKLKSINALYPSADGACSLLHKAAKQGFVHATEKLIKEYQAKVDVSDSTDATPLFYASASGVMTTLSILLKNGANVNLRDAYDNFPLLMAVRNGHFDVAEVLLLSGADINLKGKKGNTALATLCEEGNVEAVNFLLNQGASLFSQNRENENPIFGAVKHPAVLECIIAFCEKRLDHKQMIRLFSKSDYNNRNLLHICAMKGYLKSFSSLVKLVPDYVVQMMLNTKDKNLGYTPLHHAVINNRSTFVHILSVSNEVDIDAQDNLGNTPLHLALENKMVDLVQLLNEKGMAYIKLKNSAGKSAEMLAELHNILLHDLVTEAEFKQNQKAKTIHHTAENYSYSYDAVLDDKDGWNAFAGFLRLFGQEALLNFKKKVTQYRTTFCLHPPETVAGIALEIFSEFEEKNSILVSSECRETVANLLCGCAPLKEDLFNDALEIVERRLKVIFEAFVYSDQFKEFAATKIESLLNYGEYRPISNIKTTSTLINLSASLEKTEFDTLMSFCSHSNRWKPLLTTAPKSAISTSFKSIDHFLLSPTSKPQKMIRCSGIIENSIEEVLNTITSSKFKSYYDSNLAVDEMVDFCFTSDIAYSVLLENFPAVWPVQNRDFVTYNSATSTSSSGYAIIKKSTTNEPVPERKGTVRALCYQGWVLEPVGAESTRYVHIYCYDMRSSSSLDNIWKVVMEKKALNLHKGLQRAMEESKKTFFKREASSGLISTLEYSQQKHMEENAAISASSLLMSSHLSHKKRPASVTLPHQQKNPLVKRVSYISRAASNFNLNELNKIGDVATANNSSLKITGMLLYSAGTFYQVIEGKQEVLDPLLEKIFHDKRHTDIKVVKTEENLQEHERQFAGWHMNTVQLDSIDHYFTENMKTLIAGALRHSHAEESPRLSDNLLCVGSSPQ